MRCTRHSPAPGALLYHCRPTWEAGQAVVMSAALQGLPGVGASHPHRDCRVCRLPLLLEQAATHGRST